MSDIFSPLASGISSLAGATGSIVMGALNYNENKANNEFNRNMATQAFEAQEAQRAINNERYVEELDYNRALQDTVFQREDTAMQRAVEDGVAAGFSPLAALGHSAGSGAIVSSPSQVSNSPTTSGANLQISDSLQRGFEHFASAGNQFGAMLLTQANQKADRELKLTLQSNEIASMFKRQGNDYAHDKIMEEIGHGRALELSQIQHLYQLEAITHTAQYNEALERLKQSGALEQISAKHEDSMELQQGQQEFESQYRRKTMAASVGDNYDTALEYIVPVIRKFSPELADWLTSNEFGRDILINQIQMLEATGETLKDYGNAYNNFMPPVM